MVDEHHVPVEPGEPPSDPARASLKLLRFLPLLAIGNLFVAVPALLISVGLAYFTFKQAEATERMQIAETWPYVSYSTSNYTPDGEPMISFTLANDGAGPALLRGMQIRYGGQPRENLRALLLACCADDPARVGFGESSVNGTVLRPGISATFASVAPYQVDAEVWRKLGAERHRFEVSLCYCSVFEECWVRKDGSNDPAPVDSCPAEWTQFELSPRIEQDATSAP